jgi:hypothetical protein
MCEPPTASARVVATDVSVAFATVVAVEKF